MDREPAGTTVSPSGTLTIEVKEGGDLWISGALVDSHVDRRLAISPDETFVVYARSGFMNETDLWRVALVPEASPSSRPSTTSTSPAPTQLTDWRGSEDRPVLSPDGQKLAFISGSSGVASWYVVDLPPPDLPVRRLDGTGSALLTPDSARQLTNTSLGPRRPGFAPEGFTAPPDGTDYVWTSAGLTWTEHGAAHTVVP